MNTAFELPAPDYERRDAPPVRLLGIAAGLVGGVALCLAVSLALYVARNHDAPRTHETARQTSFRGSTHAQTDIAADWARQDRAVREHLGSYGWIDRRAGIVRIPIERAMELVAHEAKYTRPSRKEDTP